MGEARSIAIFETVYGRAESIDWGEISLENITGFQSFVRVVSDKVTNENNIHVVSVLDPLFEFDVTYWDLDYNVINIMTTPWALFRSRIKEIGITQKYALDVRPIAIEGINQIMKLDIGPIENFFSFYRALQFLGSAYTNTDPDDHFTSEETWEGYSLYLLSDQNIIVTPHMIWKSAGHLWEVKLVEFETATVASSMDSNNEEDELMASYDDSESAGNVLVSSEEDDSESAGNVLVSSEEDEVDDFLQWKTQHVNDYEELRDNLSRIVVKPKLLSG